MYITYIIIYILFLWNNVYFVVIILMLKYLRTSSYYWIINEVLLTQILIIYKSSKFIIICTTFDDISLSRKCHSHTNIIMDILTSIVDISPNDISPFYLDILRICRFNISIFIIFFFFANIKLFSMCYLLEFLNFPNFQ